MTPGEEANGSLRHAKRIAAWTGAILGIVAVATVAQGLLIHLLSPAIASAVSQAVKAEMEEARKEWRAADVAILTEVRSGKSDIVDQVQGVHDDVGDAATKAQVRVLTAKMDSVLSGRRR